MWKKRNAFLTLLLLVIISGSGVAQSSHNNHNPYDGALEFQMPLLNSLPSLPITAPPDVVAGYLYFNWLATNQPTRSIDSAFALLTYSDTLKTLVKFLYELDDYDPILFHRFIFGRTHGSWLSMPAHLDYISLQPRISVLYADTQRTSLLSSADIIARVRVNSIHKKIDTLAHTARHAVLVNATIIEPLKGKTVPSCLSFSGVKSKQKSESPLDEDSLSVLTGKTSTTTADSGACLQWEYCPEWFRSPMKSWRKDNPIVLGYLVKDDGSDWIKPDSEYVVFLSFRDNGHDSTTDYSTLTCTFGAACGMYPIQAGSVQDPFDDFGFGVNQTVSNFILGIKNRIYSILHP